MTTSKPRYSKKDMAQRGQKIFERIIKPTLKAGMANDYLLIDIESGDYEIDQDMLAAMDRLRARQPNAQIWTRRIKSPYAHRFGASLRKEDFE